MLVAAWKERAKEVEFGHNGSKSKNVDGRVIVSAVKKDLWGTVPASRYVVGKRWTGSYFSG